jgi:hypothetical protein
MLYIVEDNTIYGFKSAHDLKKWIVSNQDLMTYPKECGAVVLGHVLPKDLTVEIAYQLIQQERIDRTVAKKKISRKSRYRNNR